MANKKNEKDQKDEKDQKNAKIKIDLKAKSGYRCKMESEISANQWRDINMVIEGKLKSK